MDSAVFKHYKLGIEKIDNEHWELITLMEKVIKCARPPCDECKILTDKLRDMFYSHCSDEEDYMASINYPYLQEHKDSHKMIAVELELCIKRVLSGFVDKYVTDRMIRIFITHIDHQDLQILEFINKNRM